MHMHVGNHAQAAAFADVPERAEVPPVETYDAGVERMRIEIVIEDEVDDPTAVFHGVAEEERAALTAGGAPALAQARKEALPKAPRARQLMPRRPQAGNNLRN